MKILQILPFLFSLSSVTLAQNFCSASGHNGNKLELASDSRDRVGKIGSVDYEVWADGGNNSATFYSDGSFSCKFSNTKDYLCRTGVSFSARYPSEIGQITAEYKVVKQNAQNVGYSYVGVYGWTLNSGISGVFEFYIVDNWLSQGRPGDWVGNEKKGDFTIDGGQYTVYKNVNGNLTQYFSLRKTPRDCGTIDVTAHFNQWEKIGLKMGKITEVKVLGEAGNVGGGCSGTVDFPYAKVYINGKANTGETSANSGGNNGGNNGGNTGNNNGGNNGWNNGGNNGGNNGWNNGGNNGWNNGGNNGWNNGGNNAGNNATNSKCTAKIQQQGYKCCSDNCTVIYVDNDGYWGVENNQWCGCGTQAPKCLGKQGYPCCTSTKEVYAKDADGSWGVENNNWCYIG